MTINIEAILIGILAITVQMLIYYQFLIKPIIEKLDAINAKLDKLTEQNHDKPE